MQYDNIEYAEFISRPNRFVAEVLRNGQRERVHVPNTGRCRELFQEGTEVVLSRSNNNKRKLPFSLISVYKGERLVNIDSQNPNRLVREALESGRLLGFIPRKIRREYTFGSSRIDLMFEDERYGRGLIEVKGCTLEIEGRALFPDAPTERGIRHLRELIAAAGQGWRSYVVFAVQMKGVHSFSPNAVTHPEFAETLREAAASGVGVLAFDTLVKPAEVVLDKPVEVKL
ncbi:MAG: DNA/RNA nuclease SfsA [Bacillota bacterium]|jgi:sugar fermentation stimulation protein A